MSRVIKNVVIVGGGTAGWLTAAILSARSKAQDAESIQVTLVESPNVPTIGVGEGTWPTMRRTLKAIGVREADFLRECQASFKQGAKFTKWVTGEEDDAYYHPLVLPHGYFDVNMARVWLNGDRSQSFSNAVCPQERVCEAGLAPKKITSAEYESVANYAYHLDAGRFGVFLRDHCVAKLGVRHVSADVVSVRSDEAGDIAAVVTKQAGELEGDLFVDCTGMKSLLLGQHFGVEFLSCKNTLFIDRAIAVQLPYENEDSPITPHTVSTAQASGWIWDIGLQTRRGVGHVFSSAHASETEAEDTLRAYVRGEGADPDALSFRHLKIEPGHRERFWERNCVAVGLSAGFLEPLEASAILLIEISANFIADQLPPTSDAMPVVANRFNQTFRYRWDRIIDFLKLHYVLSRRTDSEFWIDNRAEGTIPDSLRELLDLWRYQPPWHDDFDRAVEVFPAASYQYVLYGMGFETAVDPRGVSSAIHAQAEQLFRRNESETAAMLQGLPSNRDLLNKIATYGLAAV